MMTVKYHSDHKIICWKLRKLSSVMEPLDGFLSPSAPQLKDRINNDRNLTLFPKKPIYIPLQSYRFKKCLEHMCIINVPQNVHRTLCKKIMDGKIIPGFWSWLEAEVFSLCWFIIYQLRRLSQSRTCCNKYF